VKLATVEPAGPPKPTYLLWVSAMAVSIAIAVRYVGTYLPVGVFDVAVTIRVVLYARLGRREGGRSRFVKSLVQGFTDLNSSDVEYILVMDPETGDWIRNLVSDTVSIAVRPWESRTVWARHTMVEPIKERIRPVATLVEPVLSPLAGAVSPGSDMNDNTAPSVPELDQFFESLDPDVIHWLARYWERSSVPMVYSLGDVQDRRYPEHFTISTKEWRETFCKSGCREADAVITASEFVASNIATEYGVPRSQIHTIHRGAPTEYDETSLSVEQVCDRFDIEPGFAFYPGKKWEHKNHSRLIEALGQVKQEYGTDVPLVCTGAQSPPDQFEGLKATTRRLGLEESVHWLGYVGPDVLLALYEAAGFLVFPTLYEGQGFPLLEAMTCGTATACSDIPPLREYGGDAPHYFDPKSVDEITEALWKLYSNNSYRMRIASDGRRRATDFSWETTARAYESVYKSVA